MYAINLCMQACRAGVAGGGKVALRKVRGLLAAGIEVVVIAPEALPEIAALTTAGKVIWHKKSYSEFVRENRDNGINIKFMLFFAATDNAAANREMCCQARKQGALVNNATDPADCDFFVPSTIQRGKLHLTASTEGGSPAFAKLLRRDMEKRYHEDFGVFLEKLEEIRQQMKEQQPDTKVRQAFWQHVMTEKIFNLILEHRLEQAEDEIRRKISSAGTESSYSPGGNTGKIQHSPE